MAPGSTVALYAGKDSEVDTLRLDEAARRRGLVVAYPRVHDHTRALTFHAVERAALEPSRFGLLEPSADTPAVELTELAAFIVPGLGFDRSGGRIGWGRGHYDATFTAAGDGPLRIGLAFSCQVLDEVPREAHDVGLHILITEGTTLEVV